MYITYPLIALLFGPYAVSSAVVQPASSLSSPNNRPYPLNDFHNPQCHRVHGPGMPGLNPTNCVTASELLCQHFRHGLIHPGDPPLREWIWIEQPGCAVAFYRPPFRYHMYTECEDIFSGIIDLCARNSRFNAGSVNVLLLPDFSQDGRAEDERRYRYLLAPERLTL